MDEKIYDLQHPLWESYWESNRDNSHIVVMKPSESAERAAQLYKKKGIQKILELGGGQGRDTFFFAQNGFHVDVIDYSAQSVETINEKAKLLGLVQQVHAIQHDIRKPIPFPDQAFDACYSHMLYCMALTNLQIQNLSNETNRVLKTKGLIIFTVRNTKDPLYQSGIHRGEQMYEINEGFIVHFYNEEKIKEIASDSFNILELSKFEEGELPKRLYYTVLVKR